VTCVDPAGDAEKGKIYFLTLQLDSSSLASVDTDSVPGDAQTTVADNIESQSMFALRRVGVKAARRALSFRPLSPTLIKPNGLSRPLSTPALFTKDSDQVQQDGAAFGKAERPENVKPERKTSLRRVGLEAERSRVVVRHKGGLRTLEHGVETKVDTESVRVTNKPWLT
jgi:hypothetical protein